jgi:DNA-binding MarR family transcriptional regulator
MDPKHREDALAVLAQELGRKKKFHSQTEAAVLAILRTAAVLRRALAVAFEEAGLTMAQYNVLRILRGTPEGLPTLQIRRRMLEEAAGITRLIDKLSRGGLVERDRPGGDRRQVLCRITRKGLQILERHEAHIDYAHANLIRVLETDEAIQLVALLMKVMDGVRKSRASLS